jgi:hypothetical protein
VISKKELWKTIPTTYEQLTPQKYRKYGNFAWSLIMLFIGIADIAYRYRLSSLDYPLSSACLLLIGVLLTLFTGWGREMGLEVSNSISTFVDMPKKQVDIWLQSVIHNSLTGNWIKWLSGCFVAIAGSSTLIILGDQGQHNVPLQWSVISHIPLFFFCGVTSYSAAYALTLPLKLGQLPIKVPLYQDKFVGVSSLNGAILILSIASLFFYGLLFVAVNYGPFPKHYLMFVWLGIIGAVVIVIFPNSVWGLHNAMKNAKRDALVKLSLHLEKSIQESIDRPTKENLDIVKSLFEFRNEIAKLPEWPIDARTFLTALSAVLLSIIPTIIQLVFK